MGRTGSRIAFMLALVSISGAALAQPFRHAEHVRALAPQLLNRIKVLGNDDRVPLPGEYQKLARGIGIIFEPGARWACTAFCVRPNIIASNAHCLIGRAGLGRKVNLSKVQFVLAPHSRSRGVLKSSIAYTDREQPHLSVFAGHYRATRQLREFADDWAFAKLTSPRCEGFELAFADMSNDEIRREGRNGRLFMIGFHGDKKLRGKWLSNSCTVRSPSDRGYFLSSQRRLLSRAPHILPHTCDAYQGASGSPIFVGDTDGAKVVAINSGSIGYSRYRRRRNSTRRQFVLSRNTNTAIKAQVFLGGLGRFESENLLSGKDDLRRLQELLKAVGYYRGPIDKLYGPGTRAAVIKYEQFRGLSLLGMPTSELLMDLTERNRIAAEKQAAAGRAAAARGEKPSSAQVKSAAAKPGAFAGIGAGSSESKAKLPKPSQPQEPDTVVAAVPKPQPATAPPNTSDVTVQAQRRLQELGCYIGAIDGLWGAGSQRALEWALGAQSATGGATVDNLERLESVSPGKCEEARAKFEAAQKKQAAARKRSQACMPFDECMSRCNAGTLRQDRGGGSYCTWTCSNDVPTCD